MASEKEKTQRRVYVLPTELVERIVAFQEEKNYPSEVEAVRKLLDEALLHRDTAETIIDRFKSRLEKLKMPAEVAKDVLVGHPLISDISFERDAISFTLNNLEKYRITDKGTTQYKNTYGKSDWLPWPPSILDDDIPF